MDDAKELTVELAIRKMGHSQGARIPKPVLAQVGLQGWRRIRPAHLAGHVRPGGCHVTARPTPIA
jgi:hypothetical protein